MLQILCQSTSDKDAVYLGINSIEFTASVIGYWANRLFLSRENSEMKLPAD